MRAMLKAITLTPAAAERFRELTATETDPAIGLRVYTTATNLLGRKPEILPTVGGRTGFGPGLTGDLIGRRFVLGAEYKF